MPSHSDSNVGLGVRVNVAMTALGPERPASVRVRGDQIQPELVIAFDGGPQMSIAFEQGSGAYVAGLLADTAGVTFGAIGDGS